MFLDQTTAEFALRLILAAGLGAVVGVEREMAHKPAGLRTHMLISLGAALFAVTSILNFGSSDVARVVANIVVGIGFVGAGSIIALRGHVQGITTAASLWTVAAIGFAAGMGNYIIAVFAAILVFIILQIRVVEKVIARKK